MKMDKHRTLVLAVLFYWTLTIVAFVGCYGSRSKDIDESSNDSGEDSAATPEADGGEDSADTPENDGGEDSADTPENDGGEDSAVTPEIDGGKDGAVTKETDEDEDSAIVPATDGGEDSAGIPDAGGGDSNINNPEEPRLDASQLTESKWTTGEFSDRNDKRWFTIDVVSGNIYHIYIDDEFGSGLHYADEKLYFYEGAPSDLHDYFEFVDVFSDDGFAGFYSEPYDYKAGFSGKLYILTISDNPGYQTFEIRYEVN